jgi:hypothetical protein
LQRFLDDFGRFLAFLLNSPYLANRF